MGRIGRPDLPRGWPSHGAPRHNGVERVLIVGTPPSGAWLLDSETPFWW
jgi:hypothetical protein